MLNVDAFKRLGADISKPSHAYLFYGDDKALNVELAKVFIASIFCGKIACFECESCKRMEIGKNPDLLIIDKPSLQVGDVEGLIENVQLKPMVYNYKVVFITNADGMNEQAQNKLLKTLEEPNAQVVFVLTCTNIEKLLPTIRSRVSKFYLPRINLDLVAEELKMNGKNIDKFTHCDISLTDSIKYSDQSNCDVLQAVQRSIMNLKSTTNIPGVVSEIKIKPEQRREYLGLMLDAVDCALTSKAGVFDESLIAYMQQVFSPRVLIKMLKLIDGANKMLDSNVNFNYVLDKLFYDILKENYLCK